MFILAQTLSEDWVITKTNPEDTDGEAELAVFHVSATAPNSAARVAMERAAAEATVALAWPGVVRVESHCPETVARMTHNVMKAGGCVRAAA